MNGVLASIVFGLTLAAPSLAIAPIDPLFDRALCASPITVSQQGPLLSADPRPNEDTWIYDNQISMAFNQPVETHSVTVTDSEGCTVSQGLEAVGGGRVVVRMKACKRMGYPGGHMLVRYTVNGVSGEYRLHIRHHH